MRPTVRLLFPLWAGLAVGCGSSTSAERSPVIAAAANLDPVLAALAPGFTADVGVRPTFSFGATGTLARQLENGAPFDVFVAADTATVHALAREGHVLAASVRVYARGRLAVWRPPGSGPLPDALGGLAGPRYRRIAVANPELAPYGAAAVQSLRAAGIWEQVASRVVYGENVAAARQFVATGNADVALLPLSLVPPGDPRLLVPNSLHAPLDQALGIARRAEHPDEARAFVAYLTGPQGRALLRSFGYETP